MIFQYLNNNQEEIGLAEKDKREEEGIGEEIEGGIEGEIEEGIEGEEEEAMEMLI